MTMKISSSSYYSSFSILLLLGIWCSDSEAFGPTTTPFTNCNTNTKPNTNRNNIINKALLIWHHDCPRDGGRRALQYYSLHATTQQREPILPLNHYDLTVKNDSKRHAEEEIDNDIDEECVMLGYNRPRPRSTPSHSATRKGDVYKHLYRHAADISLDCWLRCVEPKDFMLSCGYTRQEWEQLVTTCPKLAELSVHDQLAPRMQFLAQTLQGADANNNNIPHANRLVWLEDDDSNGDNDSNSDDENPPHALAIAKEARATVPATYFASRRLDQTLGPWHAYLQHAGLIGRTPLWKMAAVDKSHGGGMGGGDKETRLDELLACQSPADVVHLATAWSSRHQNMHPMGGSVTTQLDRHTESALQEFCRAFGRGLWPAVKNIIDDESNSSSSSSSSSSARSSSRSHDRHLPNAGQWVQLLLDHGANYLENDTYDVTSSCGSHGASLVHWAAGTGNIAGLRALLAHYLDDEELEEALLSPASNGATPLHWAAAGIDGGTGELGVGGHAEAVQVLLDAARDRLGAAVVAQMVRAQTWSTPATTPLVWAASACAARHPSAAWDVVPGLVQSENPVQHPADSQQAECLDTVLRSPGMTDKQAMERYLHQVDHSHEATLLQEQDEDWVPWPTLETL